jgi:lipopolysaccharide export system protein LptA
MDRRLPLTRLAMRGLAAGALVGAVAALAVGSQAGAQGIAAFNSDQPVNYAADRIELQDKQQRVVLSGNVDITQGDLRLRAARTTVAYTNADSLKIQRMDATGGVHVTRGDESATGDVAIYDFNKRIITMVGNVQLKRANGDNLNGARMVIDLNSGVSSVNGGGGSAGKGGRVSRSFAVPKNATSSAPKQ